MAETQRKPRWRWLKRLVLAVSLLFILRPARHCRGGLGGGLSPVSGIPKKADSFDLTELNAIRPFRGVRRERAALQQTGRRFAMSCHSIRSHRTSSIPSSPVRIPFYELSGSISGHCAGNGKEYPGGRSRRGASTITQQLARNTFVLDENKWRRKVIEALLASCGSERQFSKQQILEAYSNRIYYGRGLYGVETASRSLLRQNGGRVMRSRRQPSWRDDSQSEPSGVLSSARPALHERDQVLSRMQELTHSP